MAALGQQGEGAGAISAEARAGILDALAHAVGALVLSRACPDDSPLADEILAASREAITRSLPPKKVRTAATRG